MPSLAIEPEIVPNTGFGLGSGVGSPLQSNETTTTSVILRMPKTYKKRLLSLFLKHTMVRRLKRRRKRLMYGQTGGFLNALLRDLQQIPKADRKAIPRDLKRMAKGLFPPAAVRAGIVPFVPKFIKSW